MPEYKIIRAMGEFADGSGLPNPDDAFQHVSNDVQVSMNDGGAPMARSRPRCT